MDNGIDGKGHGRGPGDLPIQTQHDWSDGTEISASVIHAVAAVVDREPTTLEPLYDAVDPDALDQLFRSRRTGTGGSRLVVSFPFNGCHVTVEADGTISIGPEGDDDVDR